MAVLDGVQQWAPFQIDALGIVTLLGGSSMERMLGRLVVTPWAEYLPLLAFQVVLEDTIAETIPGFTMYNISEGIKTADLSAWWTRWLLCQELEVSETTLHVQALPTPRTESNFRFVSLMLSILLGGFLIAFSVLLEDWYGLACSTAVIITVVVRVIIVQSYRSKLDNSAEEALRDNLEVKVAVTLPTGKFVTVRTTKGVLTRCLIAKAKVKAPVSRQLVRVTGWLSFGVFIVTLGQSCLAMQLISTVWIIGPSIMVIKGYLCDESHIGKRLHIERSDFLEEGGKCRARAFAALEMNEREEESMLDWEFFPRRTNSNWWRQYKLCENEYRHNTHAFDNWSDRLAKGLLSKVHEREEVHSDE